jgi:hypothetical protein
MSGFPSVKRAFEANQRDHFVEHPGRQHLRPESTHGVGVGGDQTSVASLPVGKPSSNGQRSRS